jgi:hypothetical protein
MDILDIFFKNVLNHTDVAEFFRVSFEVNIIVILEQILRNFLENFYFIKII